MFDKSVIKFNAIALIVISVPAAMFGLPWVGLIALLLGAGNLLVSLFFIPSKERKRGLTFLFCSGVLFLIGFSICSTNSLSIH
jgi:hypothetical protein